MSGTAPATAVEHARKNLPDQLHGRDRVHRHQSPSIAGVIFAGTTNQRQRGVVHQDVDGAVCGLHLADGISDSTVVGEIEGEPVAVDRLGDGAKPFGVAAQHRDCRTPPGKLLRDVHTNAV